MIKKEILTDRLILNELETHDHLFILELINSAGWLEFIGDRNIRTAEDALAYVEKIIASPFTKYWKVKLKANDQSAGIITLIKRDDLEHYDIGFAFLPAYTGAGYAFEAINAVLDSLPETILTDKILAITKGENMRSVKLLQKLKFTFERQVDVAGKILLQYTLSADEIQIGKVTRSFFNLFNNTLNEPDFEPVYQLCTASASIIRKSGTQADVYGLESFIKPRKEILTDGTLQQFSEFETDEETRVVGNIAQRYSKYRKQGLLNGVYFESRGHKFFHFMKEDGEWKIAQVVWEDEI
ncbi:GNAT family N-acetyltransferase [uncultured Pedobacter sp.]|uniref:GNAT family N-acetyltransferase n=1 Tax=uncultured Pedobacter sp. TaxID=246139 RepID=UPI0025E9D337|nr:GNAT family N-acetyltransferase [uncultured Pedobacter sp.]